MEVVCRWCGARQRVFGGERTVDVVDISQLIAVLEGQPAWSTCGACHAQLGVPTSVSVVGEDWSEIVELDGSGRRPDITGQLAETIARHVNGVIGQLRHAAGVRDRESIGMARYAELTAEAIASAVVASRGFGANRTAVDLSAADSDVDLAVGDAQGGALITAALAVADDPHAALLPLLTSHVAPGLILPRAVDAMRHSIRGLLERGGLDASTRLCLLSVNAAAHAAAGEPDPLAREFTRLWISWAWTAQTEQTAEVLRLRLPKELLSVAVQPEELVRAVHEAVDMPGDALARLQLIAESAGHPRLIRSVARDAPLFAAASSDILKQALAHAAGLGEQSRLVEGLRHVLGVLRTSGRTSELAEMTDYAIGLGDGSDTTRARLLVQLGSAAKDARTPTLFLEAVGDTPRPWEADLGDHERLSLATERSTALRMTGRADEAFAVLSPFRKLTFDEDTTWRLEFNLVMIERDQGDLGHGLDAMERLLLTAPDRDTRFLARQSLARVATALGRHRNAVDHLAAAIALAQGPDLSQVPTLRAHLAALLAAEGDTTGALDELAELEPELDGGSQAALGAADAVVVLLERGEDLDDDLVRTTYERLLTLEQEADARGDRTVRASAVRVRARLRELLGDAQGAIDDLESLLSFAQDPFALAALAVLHSQLGQVEPARARLLALPDALRHEYGATQDTASLIDATGRLHAEIQRVSTVMMAGRPAPFDVRLAAELSRDAIGRARAWRRGPASPPSREALTDRLSDAHLASLAPARGTVWVMEWWQGADGVVTLQTRIGSDRTVGFRSLSAMPVEAPTVAAEVLTRLQNWWPGRPGDPLAHDGWEKLQSWLAAEMAEATDDDHLVVIEHAAFTGLPWHAMDVPWTTSYIPSWSALLDLPCAPAVPARVGMLSVPVRSDSPTTVEAFRQAVLTFAQDATQFGLVADLRAGPSADIDAVRDLLSRNDIVTLLCHGLIDPDQRELALLVARNGELPTQHPIAAASPEGRAHRITWRALQDLDHGPTLILSGACSTGQGLVAGMGERLGLFGALRSTETRAVVAPAWDAVAADVPQQLGHIRNLVLTGSPLAAAVRATCDTYASRLPAWRSRVLCIEGDWR